MLNDNPADFIRSVVALGYWVASFFENNSMYRSSIEMIEYITKTDDVVSVE